MSVDIDQQPYTQPNPQQAAIADQQTALMQPTGTVPNALPAQTPAGVNTALNAPTSQPTQPSAPAQPQSTPQQDHASLFQKIFGVIAGGDRVGVRDAQGNPVTDKNGNVQTQRASVKQLGAGILAGALASMAAGFQHLPTTDENGRVVTHNNEAAAVGAKVGEQNTQKARLSAFQQMSDDQRLRAYQTADQNFKLVNMAITSHRLGDEYITGQTAEFQPLHSWINQEAQTRPEIAALIHGDDLSEDDMQKMMADDQAHGVKDTAMPSGTRPEIGPDGKPTGRLEQLWMVLRNDGKVTLTPDLKQKYGLTTVGDGQSVSMQALMTQAISQVLSKNVAQSIASLGQKQDEAFGGNHSDVTLSALQQKNPALKSQANLQKLQGIAGKNPAEAVAYLRANKSGDLADTLVNAFGIDDDKWADKRKHDEAQAVKETKSKTPEQLAELAQHPETPEGKAAMNTIATLRANKAADAAADAAAKLPFELRKQQQEQELRTGLPADAGRLLANGDLTLTELKSRGSTPKFITDAVNAAKAIDPQYDAQKADADYRIAGNQANQTFFGSANSLVNQGGTLDQLAANYKRLNNTGLPLYNKWKDYAEYQAGDPAMAGFYQTALGVADDYAKVMGGGTGSDTSRLQVMQSFANAHNPQQMQAAIDAARNAVNSQINSRIGNSSIMRRMYGATTSAAPVNAPPVSVLKEGVLTTFKNGQVWTLQNGKQVQVQ